MKIDYPEAIYLDITSEIEEKYRVNTCAHEPRTVAWIESFRPDEIFYDIGANVGVFSLIAAKRGTQTYAFEPNFLNHHKLCHNILLNNLTDRIIPLNVALTDMNGLCNFEFYSLDCGDAYSAIDRSKIKYFQSSGCAKLAVPCMSLDDAIRIWKLPIPTHIKIDVDGEEPGIINGSRNLLTNTQLVSVNVEINEDKQESYQITHILESYGFRIVEQYQDPAPDDQGDLSGIHNYLFWRPHA